MNTQYYASFKLSIYIFVVYSFKWYTIETMLTQITFEDGTNGTVTVHVSNYHPDILPKFTLVADDYDGTQAVLVKNITVCDIEGLSDREMTRMIRYEILSDLAKRRRPRRKMQKSTKTTSSPSKNQVHAKQQRAITTPFKFSE
jgi:hypothetical protein